MPVLTDPCEGHRRSTRAACFVPLLELLFVVSAFWSFGRRRRRDHWSVFPIRRIRPRAVPKYPIIPGLDPVETDPLDQDPDDDARTNAWGLDGFWFWFFRVEMFCSSFKASSSWAPLATSSSAPFPRSESRSARGRSKPSGVTVRDLMSLSCTAQLCGVS